MALRLKILPNTIARCYSTITKIAVTSDESTYVAWHPKQDFPYDCTRPLPESKAASENTVLKSEYSPQLKEVFNKKTPEIARQELMNITYTTKHRWFPRSRDRKAKRIAMDREYL